MPTPLSSCWADLTTGQTRIVSVYSTPHQHFMEFGPAEPGSAPNAADLDLLGQLLRGEAQKVVAADFGCSVSRVAMAATRALHAFGLRCGASDVPMLVVMMAHAGPHDPSSGEILVPIDEGGWLLSVPRPDAVLADALSQSEHAVVRLLVDALSYAEIATWRGVSARTIANQVASVYSKLDVSGRLSLLCKLARRQLRSFEPDIPPRSYRSRSGRPPVNGAPESSGAHGLR